MMRDKTAKINVMVQKTTNIWYVNVDNIAISK